MGGNTVTAIGLMGADKVTASGNIGSTVTASALNISNAENVEIAIGTTAATYIDGSKLTNVGEIAVSNDTSGGTVSFTNMPAGVGVGLGIGAVELGASTTVNLSYALADATGDEDALSLNYSDTLNAASSVTLTTAGIETLNISAEKAGSNTSTLVNTNMTASTINVTGGISTNTVALGALNKATSSVLAGSGKSAISMTSATGYGMTVTANGSVANNITLSTKADTVTLTKELAAINHTINGGATASASTSDTLNATLSATDTNFTNISGFEVLNLTVKNATATGFDNASEDGGLNAASVVNILGGNANSSFTVATAEFTDGRTTATPRSIDATDFSGSINLQFAANALDISTTVKGGSSVADSITTIISDAASSTAGNNPTLTGIEELTVKSTNADVDAVINLGNATGLAKVTADFINAANADQIEIDSLAAGVPVYVKATGTLDILDVGLASTSGGDDALTVVLQTNTTSLDLDAAGIESLSITAAGAGGTVNLAGVSPTTGSATTVTLSGASAFTLKSLNTGITNVDGSALGGALTVDKADRDADAITISGGVANDSIAMENAADVLSGGTQAVNGADELVVNYAAVLAGITVDLSAADQVVSMDGSPNTAVQSGFENIDLSSFSGFGAVVTGSDGNNVITGTAGVDRINAGKGADTIVVNSGTVANDDQMNGGSGDDTLKVAAGLTVTIDGDTDIVSVENISFDGAGVAVMLGQTEAFKVTSSSTADLDNDFTGGSGNDTFTSTNAADTDELIHTMVSSTAGTDTYVGFTFGTGKDLLNFPAAVTTATGYTEVTSAPTLDTSATGVLVLDFDVATAASDMTPAALYTAASGGGDTAGNAAEVVLVAVTTDATNAADVFLFRAVMNANSDGFASIDHVVTLTGVTDLTDAATGNFDVS